MESKIQTGYGIENLFMSSPSVIPFVSEKSYKDQNNDNDIINLFGKEIVSYVILVIMN